MPRTKRESLEPSRYRDLPLEEFTITDLTDALTVAKAARILKTTARSIYAQRNTNIMSPERLMILRAAVEQHEELCRERLVIQRTNHQTRRAMRTDAA